MQISYNGVKFIQNEEGFRGTAYLDSGGVPTLGFGSTWVDGKPVEMGMTCTEKQAELYMETHLANVQTAINQMVKAPLTQNQFDALASFCYNLGTGALRESTLLKLLNQYQYTEAAKQFDRWVHVNGKPVPGLIARRRRERSMFESK